MRASDYINVVLEPFLDEHLPLKDVSKCVKGELLFQQYNAPCHSAQTVEK